MIKKIFSKLFRLYNVLYVKRSEKQDIQVAKNFFFNLELNLDKIDDINLLNYCVFSQNGEDGILQYLIKSLKLKNIRFIEIGTEGYEQCNTRYIFETMRCDGLIIDPVKDLKNKARKNVINFWKNNLKVVNDYATPENINLILENNNFHNDIDIFSLDIDSIDYWIIKKLKKNVSKIFVAEYNSNFGPELEITVPNIKDFNRTNYHYSNLCWGVSLKALIKIMIEKNYTFIGSDEFNINAFFVSNEYINKIKLKKPNIENLSEFTIGTYNEHPNKDGNPVFIEPEKILPEIKDCEVINLKNNKLVKIGELL